jgi:hypothetical protein
MTAFERFLLKQFFNKSSRLTVLSERRRTEHGEMQPLDQMICNGQGSKFLKKAGATRRIRIADLLTTKNN